MSQAVSYRNLGRYGRLGNALFQLASTAGIAHKLGTVPRFNADWMHRPYFSVPDEFFTDDFTDTIEADATSAVEHIDPRARPYLQDMSLFTNIWPTILKWFQPSPEAQRQISECAEFTKLSGPILSVHVRRGDKVPGQDPGTPNNHEYFKIPDLSYYLNAIASSRIRDAIVVFGDDPGWNARHIPADYHHLGVPRPKEQDPTYLTAPVLDHIDLFLQARCDAHIISGSTFGIWAALLAEDTEAIYPYPVYGRKLAYIDESLLYPATWRRFTLQGEPC